MVCGVDLKYGNSCKSQVMVVAKDSPVALKLKKDQLHTNLHTIRQIIHR